MSALVTGWVLKHSEATRATRLVLLVLADHADSDGRQAWPSVATIAQEARCSESTVHTVLRRLEEVGAVVREGTSRHLTVSYRVVMTTAAAGAAGYAGADPSGERTPPVPGGSGGTPDPSGEHPATPPVPGPEPSIEPSRTTLPSPGACARERRPVSYRGRRVDEQLVLSAERLLGVFCDAAGRCIGARRDGGTASPALTQVIGALLARPDVPEATWEAAVRAIVADPPDWIDSQLQLGHVFGERAAEWALAAATAAPADTVRPLQRRRPQQWTPDDYEEAGRRLAAEEAVA